MTRNTLWNLGGQVIPLIVALFTIPPLVRGLGSVRFGLLSLAWALIGYFSLFDLGLGRALTQLMSQRIAQKNFADVPSLLLTSVSLLGLLGTVGGAVLAVASSLILGRLLKIPPDMVAESRWAFYWVAVCIPFVTISSGLRGILEAEQEFGLLALVRMPIGILTFVAPLLVMLWTPSLAFIVLALAVVRILSTLWMGVICFVRSRTSYGAEARFRTKLIYPLLTFGGWMTVTNIVGPIMTNMDRFVIGALVSVGAVTYYVTPYEMVTKLLIISGSVAGALFPVFSSATHSDAFLLQTKRLYTKTLWSLTGMLLPAVLVLLVAARWVLAHWISPDFASHGTLVLQILSVGVFFNSLATIPFTLIQALGRPDRTAQLHLLELPVYAVSLLALTRLFGITGTAVAWTLRTFIDAAMMSWLAKRYLSAFTRQEHA